MIHYHAWFDLKEGESDVGFADAVARYLGHLKQQGQIAGWRLTRRTLGLGPPQLPEFNLVIEAENLAQLDRALGHVTTRAEPVESLHHAVNSRVKNLFFALYRDFPDPQRVRGQEKF
jgi:hypothetical protein